MTLHLTRARLRNTPDVAALARLLLPADEESRVAAGHRLVWALFADAPDRERDFLWRADDGDVWHRATFLILSRRAPENRNGLFEIETKPFTPTLRSGQHIGFRLRASPGVSERRPGARRGKRVDPVARALRRFSTEERAELRYREMQEIGAAWLSRQGERAGFTLVEEPADEGRERPLLRVDGDRWRTVPRDGGRQPVRFSVLDFEGVLQVTDPSVFLAALERGFGRARAFGCGLMLIRRA